MNKKEQFYKHCKQVVRNLEKDVFELKDNEEHGPSKWKIRVEWNKTETKILSGKQQIKVTEIANYIRSSDNPTQSNAYSIYWYPLTGLVEEPADNTYYYFI